MFYKIYGASTIRILYYFTTILFLLSKNTYIVLALLVGMFGKKDKPEIKQNKPNAYKGEALNVKYVGRVDVKKESVKASCKNHLKFVRRCVDCEVNK